MCYSVVNKVKRSILSKLSIFFMVGLTIFIYGCSSFSNGKRSELAVGPVLPVKGNDDTKYFIIFGFGIVKVNCPKNETAVMVTDAQSLGISISDQPGLKLGVGYSSCTVTAVPDSTRAEDIRTEVIRKPFGSLTVTTDRAKLKDSSENGGHK